MINFSGGFRGLPRGAIPIAAAIVLGCGGVPRTEGDRAPLASAPEGRLWVLAPHPDDELLMAGEVLRAAVARARPVSVLVMTNGDLSCTRDGHARQAETVAALAVLGVPEDDVHFLGYPDGWLDALGAAPFGPLPRTQADGSCGEGDRTYASRGHGGTDLHTQLTGASGAYVANGPVDDLAALLRSERPTEIVTTHGIDTHPDHAMTYVYLRRAIEAASIAPPRILRSVVHQGPCWPNGAGNEPCPSVPATSTTPFPAFAPPLEGYAPTRRVRTEDGGASTRGAIAHYTSQLGTPIADESWLSSFARADEIFWEEQLEADADHPGWLVHAAPGPVVSVSVVAPFDPAVVLPVVGAIELAIDPQGAALRADDVELRRLPIPHGESASTEHAWDVRVDRRHEHPSLAEVTVRRDGEIWMLAVTAVQRLSGGPPQSVLESRSR